MGPQDSPRQLAILCRWFALVWTNFNPGFSDDGAWSRHQWTSIQRAVPCLVSSHEEPFQG